MSSFSYRSARSGSLTGALGAAILVETLAVHLLLAPHHQWAAWLLTLLSVWVILWLARDYRAFGSGAVHVSETTVRFPIGLRFQFELPRSEIDRAFQPTFKDLPAPGSNEGRDYLNLTKPANPNVLLLVRAPVRVRLPGGLHRSVRRLSIHLDDPDAFITEIAKPTAA